MSLIFDDIGIFCGVTKENDVLMGADFGVKKIGLAISSPSRSMALPLSVLPNDDYFFAKILKLAKEKNVGGFVVGVPLSNGAIYGDSAVRAKNFAIKLSKVSQIPVFLQDERRTSKAADSLLILAGYKRKERNAIDDSVAASLILESAIAKMKSLKSNFL